MIFSLFFFGVSAYSISKVTADDPEVLTKIETALVEHYKIDEIQFSLPQYLSLQYNHFQDNWKFDPSTKKIKLITTASNIEVLETKEVEILVKADGYIDPKKAERLLETTFTKNELKIKEWNDHTTKDVHIQIYLPTSFTKSLEINTATGTIEIEKNFLEKIKLSSVSGNVKIKQNSVSTIEIETISGNLTIEFAKQHVPYQFKINTLSGEITNSIKENVKSGRLISIKTVSGNVEID